ncbi:beta-glucosidase family protein [Acetobacter conturbans]|uniref:Glycosyl hydrolase n=1 Tax=Acetobacter conturbans TaxID=1737472 RepID=A0ABX0JW24_9PROT|nr:glycoside hydrolase family 3 N-terminal domain-containing protein [Acetobacter conturbans]NHN87180.1 glycosyl hydrolase [Acetobacter conturbans]
MTGWIERTLTEMTLLEKLALISGAGLFHTQAIERLEVRSLRMADGSNGLRVVRPPETSAPTEDDTDAFFALVETGRKTEQTGTALLGASYPATCFPAASVLAASWNQAFMHEVGCALAKECRARGVDVLLGPGVNIRRMPLAGRSFEYYSEDPVLSADMAAGFIRGLQSCGVAASLKHLACNNSETERITMNSVVEERALREVYLAVFERVIKKSDPWTVMTAYNRLNGQQASEYPWLLNDVLRHQWGYDGLVVSDWHAIRDRPAALLAGCDLDMPLSKARQTRLANALAAGTVPMASVDESCRRMLELIVRIDEARKTEEAAPVPDYPSHHALAVRGAAEGCVLLRNEDGILPLKDEGGAVLVVGTDALLPQIQGAGSAAVTAWRVDEPLACLRERFPEREIWYAPGWMEDGTASIEREKEAVKLASLAETVVVFVSAPKAESGEDADRKNLSLLPAHDALMARLRKGDVDAIAVVIAPDAVLLPWRNDAAAIMLAGYAGQGFGQAITALLSGDRCPSGKLTTSWPQHEEDCPAALGWPGEQGQHLYREGIFVGYRWFDRRKVEPAYPFGFGLSYTKFSYNDLAMEQSGEGREQTVKISFSIANEGTVAGREVWQLYVHRHDTGKREQRMTYPLRVLREFGSMSLEAGERRRIELTLSFRDFAYFDILQQDWQLSDSPIMIDVGASSRDIRLSTTVMPDLLTMDAPLVTPETPMSAVLELAGAEESLVEWLVCEEAMSQSDAADLLARGRQSFLGIYDTLSWSLSHEPQIDGLVTALARIGRTG